MEGGVLRFPRTEEAGEEEKKRFDIVGNPIVHRKEKETKHRGKKCVP